jgi:hypothetical protein
MTQQHHLADRFNRLQRGARYRAVTAAGVAVGEYLGMESLHGDHAILLRGAAGTASIARSDVTALEATPA